MLEILHRLLAVVQSSVFLNFLRRDNHTPRSFLSGESCRRIDHQFHHPLSQSFPLHIGLHVVFLCVFVFVRMMVGGVNGFQHVYACVGVDVWCLGHIRADILPPMKVQGHDAHVA